MSQLCIIGSGNWGSAIGKLLAENITPTSPIKQSIYIWVHEEIYDGKNLSQSLNEDHVNPKYLPGIKLPNNLIANTDLIEVTKMADILVFALPQIYVDSIVKQMIGHVKTTAKAISLMKGVIINKGKGLVLLSDLIRKHLKLPCAVVMGANRAGEVANKIYGEATIGSDDIKFGKIIQQIFQTSYLKLVVTRDAVSVELLGALKNIVALASGIVEGLGHGDNTKAAFIRLCYWEILEFMEQFYKDRGVDRFTVLQSCGFAEMFTCLAHDKNLMNTPINLCYGSRNILVGMKLARTSMTLKEIEENVLLGEFAHGAYTVEEMNIMLKACDQLEKYPLMKALNDICHRRMVPVDIIHAANNHPAHL